jgi:hypothetical protein
MDWAIFDKLAVVLLGIADSFTIFLFFVTYSSGNNEPNMNQPKK